MQHTNTEQIATNQTVKARINVPVTHKEIRDLGNRRAHVLTSAHPNRRKRRAAANKLNQRQRFNNRAKTSGRMKFRETGFFFVPFCPSLKATAAAL